MATDELDVLLDHLGRQRFLIQQFRDDLRGLDVVAALYDWGGGVADVLVLRSDEDGTAFRALTGPGIDVFNPPHVLWSYASSAVWTVRALLTLPQPGRHDAPTVIHTLPPGFGLPARTLRLRGR